jgi:hypothetical protein
MVFLGGAVLANIVSGDKYPTSCICSQCTDGRQGRHVDIKAGVARARLTGIGEAGRKIRLACYIRMTWISVAIDHWQTKALLAIVLHSCFVSFSEATFSVREPRCTITSSHGKVSGTAESINRTDIATINSGFSDHVQWQKSMWAPATREIDAHAVQHHRCAKVWRIWAAARLSPSGAEVSPLTSCGFMPRR